MTDRNVIDLSSPIQTGAPVFYEMRGRWGVARVAITDFDQYLPTAYVRTGQPDTPLYRTCLVSMSDHAGTHIDSNGHFNPLGEAIDQLPLDALCGEAVLLDVSHLEPLSYDPATQTYPRIDWITPETLQEAAARAGGLRQGDIVLLKTGAHRVWPDWRYTRSLVPIAEPALHWLIDQGVRLYGMDQTTVDFPPDYSYPHLFMKQQSFQHIENLFGLDALPEGRFRMAAYPLRWQKGSASPLRVAALPASSPAPRRNLDLSFPLPMDSDAPGFSKTGAAVLPYHDIRDTGFQETKLLLFSDHASTHLESSAHFNPHGTTIDQVPLEHVLEIPATWADCSDLPAGAQIGPEELRSRLRGAPSQGGALLIYTGASRLEGSRHYWRHQLSLTPEGLRWALEQGLRVVGIDAPEIEADDIHFPAHQLMKEREFYLLENLKLWPAVLELPGSFRLSALPLRLVGATASPVRAVAHLD